MISNTKPLTGRDNAQLINQTSGEQEYYTDLRIVQAARELMMKISLDPASSATANERIKALFYFDIATDGLSQPWNADAIFLNWPFGRVENPKWCAKLVSEFNAGNFEQACVITYACTSEKWFTPLLKQPQCFLVPRTNYFTPDGKVKRGVTKGSVVTYFGPNVNRFAQKFSTLGVVKIPYQFQ